MEQEVLDTLKRSIKNYQYTEIATRLKKNSLKDLEEPEFTELTTSIFALNDKKIADLLIKNIGTIKPEMLDLDFSNYKTYNFVTDLLTRHGKDLDLSTDENCQKFFTLACQVGNKKLVNSLLKAHDKVCDYTQLTCNSTELFDMALAMDPHTLGPEREIDFFVGAFLSDNGEDRMRKLGKAGFDLTASKASGETVSDVLAFTAAEKKYPNNKSGQLRKKKDQTLLEKFDRWVKNPELLNPPAETPKSHKIIIAVTIVVAAALIAYAIGYYTSTKNNAVSDTTESTQVVEEVTTE